MPKGNFLEVYLPLITICFSSTISCSLLLLYILQTIKDKNRNEWCIYYLHPRTLLFSKTTPTPYSLLRYCPQNHRKLLPAAPSTATPIQPRSASALRGRRLPQCYDILGGGVYPGSSGLLPAAPTFITAALHEGRAGPDSQRRHLIGLKPTPETVEREGEVKLPGEELFVIADGVYDVVEVHVVGVAYEGGRVCHPLEDVGDLDRAGELLEPAVLQYELGGGDAGGLAWAADAHFATAVQDRVGSARWTDEIGLWEMMMGWRVNIGRQYVYIHVCKYWIPSTGEKSEWEGQRQNSCHVRIVSFGGGKPAWKLLVTAMMHVLPACGSLRSPSLTIDLPSFYQNNHFWKYFLK